MTSLPNDNYGRTVTIVTKNGEDTYTVDDGNGNVFSIGYPAGKDQNVVYATIHAMLSGDQDVAPASIEDAVPTLGDVLGVLASYSLIPIDGTIVTQDLVDNVSQQLQSISVGADQQASPAQQVNLLKS